MAGLDSRGVMDGAAAGFGLMDRYLQRQHTQALQEDQNDRAERRFGMEEERFDTNMADANRKRDQEQAEFVLGKVAQGMDITEDEYRFLEKNPQYWPALDSRTDQSIETAQAVIDPDNPMGPNDPQVIEAMNQLWGHRINRGDGGKKRIAGLYPGPRGDTVALELEVEKDDGTKYNAPMTRNRSAADDDPVLETPVESLINQVQGYRLLRNAFRTPEAQAQATKLLTALTGKEAKKSKPMVVNDKLVDPDTGALIADYSDPEDTTSSETKKYRELIAMNVPEAEARAAAYGIKPQNNNQYGEAFEHPQLGWVQPGPDNKLYQLDTPDQQGNAEWVRLNDGALFNKNTGETRQAGVEPPNDGTGGLDSSVISQIQQTTRNFHGNFNPDGSFLGIPEGAREKYTLAMERAQELVRKGLSVFEATNLANLSVGDQLTKAEAKRLAEQEADQRTPGLFKGGEREDYVKARVPELIAESREAEQRYNRIMGGDQQADKTKPRGLEMVGSSVQTLPEDGSAVQQDDGSYAGQVRRSSGISPEPAPQSARAEPASNKPLAPPTPGTIMSGYEFMGGNPADKNNWKKVTQ